MFRSLYTAATGMHAQETRMSVIANNLANQGTVGFKKAVQISKSFSQKKSDQPQHPTSRWH